MKSLAVKEEEKRIRKYVMNGNTWFNKKTTTWGCKLPHDVKLSDKHIKRVLDKHILGHYKRQMNRIGRIKGVFADELPCDKPFI